jgi:hypothetical protein
LERISNPYADFDFDSATHLTENDVMQVTKKSGGGNKILSLSVTNHECGQRIKMTDLLHETLGFPTSVQILKNGDHLLIGATIPKATQTFYFSTGKGKTTIYRGGIAKIITKLFNLNFSGRSSYSFHDITIQQTKYNNEALVYAVVDMTKAV